MQGRNSQRTYNEPYSNAMFQFKILKLLCLQFICLTNKFRALHSQEIFSESEIILCHNFSLKGQYIASQKIEKTCRLQFAAYSITSKIYLQGGWLGLAAVRTLLMVCMAAMPDQIELTNRTLTCQAKALFKNAYDMKFSPSICSLHSKYC